MDFSGLLEHLQSNAAYYGGGAVVLAPIIYFTRRYSLPVILYVLEISIYLGILHLVMHYLVILTKWFKEQSSMEARSADGSPAVTVEWSTPLTQFWDRALYEPQWVFYFECVAVLLIVGVVFRYRPMQIQRVRKSKYFSPEAMEKRKKAPGYRDYSDMIDKPEPKDKKKR